VPLSPREAPVELLSDEDEGQLVLPIRFQCPLCFDVLRLPIQLPCCQRHLCRECFERALELTSANCGFCRKRIVGFARKKQYQVDDVLWSEIRRCCPSVAGAASDALIDVDFVDENAPPKHANVVVEATATDVAKSLSSGPSAARGRLSPTKKVSTPARRVHASADQKTKMQRRLEAFFAGTLPSPPPVNPSGRGSRPSSAGSLRSLRSTTSSSSGSGASMKGNARGRRRLDVVGKKTKLEATPTKPKLRSTSTSLSHSVKHRAAPAVKRSLLQLKLHSPVAVEAAGRRTRQSSTTTQKVETRPRRPWLCRHCTFENTCFDTRCSMCHQYPASAPALP
jgi:hypothetical protein